MYSAHALRYALEPETLVVRLFSKCSSQAIAVFKTDSSPTALYKANNPEIVPPDPTDGDINHGDRW